MNCNRCGSLLTGNSSFCPNCGAQVDISTRTSFILTLNRPSNFIGSAISYDVYIDDQKVGKIKNGETVSFNISKGNHTLSLNKMNPVDIMVNGDITGDTVVFGSNNFGISNIRGNVSVNSNVTSVESLQEIKLKNSTNYLLIASILLPILSVILLFTLKFMISPIMYGFIIGYAFVNLGGLRNFEKSNTTESIRKKNIMAMVISTIAMFLSIFFM